MVREIYRECPDEEGQASATAPGQGRDLDYPARPPSPQDEAEATADGLYRPRPGRYQHLADALTLQG